MIQDISPRKFDNQYKPRDPKETDFILSFKGTSRRNDTLLMKFKDNTVTLPMLKEFGKTPEELVYLFSIDDTAFYLVFDAGEYEIPGFDYEKLQFLRVNDPGWICFAGFTAYHLYSWYRSVRFCGQCGTKANHDTKERMMRCPSCGNMMFPKIAPAVIIGLRHKDSLMVSRYANREYKGIALLAGFCEIGETPEETVIREVQEEVGLKAANVTYFGSQPWGIDLNLLMGYFCDVEGSTEVTIDAEELASAGFEKRENLEPQQNLMSLTATMIEEFRLGNY